MAPEHAERLLRRMQRIRHGTQASIIGDVVSDHPGRVVRMTRRDTSPIMDMIRELLPGTC